MKKNAYLCTRITPCTCLLGGCEGVGILLVSVLQRMSLVI